MNKKSLTETDIRTKFITPALTGLDGMKWNVMTQIREDVYFTNGRVLVRGKTVKRGLAKKADYILVYRPNLPLAVLEAKDKNHSVGDGMQQALEYAEILDIPYAYSSNGDAFLEHDRTATGGIVTREIPLDEFPSPEELWQRYRTAKGYTADQEWVVVQDYYDDGSGKAPRYYQIIAINRTVEAIARGETRILLVMATGTGKTYTAFQIIWRLWKSGAKKRILFLVDRNILADQTKTNDFKPFGKAMTKITHRTVDKSYEIYLCLYQAVTGTGGFITCLIRYLRKQAKFEVDERTIQECFSGIEKKHLPHILCITNLLLHGIDVPSNVRHGNTLARPLRDWGPKERVDVIATNPPFGGMEEDGIESNYPAEFRTRETADLFLVLIMKILKPGGRAGLVLPDGTLFGEGVKTRIKEALLTECNLHTIVRLPNGVFAPYTSIRTNLLFFTKGTPTKEIWYYEHPYPPGAKSYNKGKPISIAEFEAEKQWWGKPDKHGHFSKREENERAWRVSIDQIKAANFNLDLKNPHNSDEGPGDVDHLLPEYEKLLAQIADTRAKLKKELHHALTATAGT